MFAVIKTGGKQYIVREGDSLAIERVEIEAGKPISFEAMLVSDDDGKEVKIGKPLVAGAKVNGTVVEHAMGDKKIIVKYKSKSRYRRHTSHRQPFTKISIDKITV